MKKKLVKKLTVNKETIRDLKVQDHSVVVAAGSVTLEPGVCAQT